MAWYGESYRLNWGSVVGGSQWGSIDDWFDHWDGRTHTLSNGDDVIVGSFIQPWVWDDFANYAEPIQTRWVLEVASGAGTVDLSAGFDPDFSYTDPSLATQPLGTLTVAGPGTYVSGPVTVSHEQLVAVDDAVILRLQGTSGSVEITQVKLRVWPQAGAPGAFVSAGNGQAHGFEVQRWNTLGVPGGDNTGLVTASVGHEDYPDPMAREAALAAETQVQTLLASKAGQAAYFGSVNRSQIGELASAQSGAGATLFVVYSSPNQYSYSGQAYARAGLGLIRADVSHSAPELNLTGLDYGLDPNEHKFENETFARPVGGGPLQPTFAGWITGAVEVTYATSAGTTSWAKEEAVLRMQDVGDTFTPTVNSLTNQQGLPYQISASGPITLIKPVVTQSSVVQRVGLAGGQSLLVSVVTPGTEPFGESVRGLEDADFFGDPVHAYGFNVSARVDVVDTGHLIAFGPIEVWSPTAVAVKERKPRFYVTFTEVDDDPRDVSHVVGIGKPADDLSIFRVPTPLGTLRELRHGEKVSDVSVAYPLKVKLEDGSWTIVAGMTPDD